MIDFDYDFIDTEEKRTEEVAFTYIVRNENGFPITNVTRRILKKDDELMTLPELLSEFTYFLNGMTFTYVGGVTAYDQDGKDTADSSTI